MGVVRAVGFVHRLGKIKQYFGIAENDPAAKPFVVIGEVQVLVQELAQVIPRGRSVLPGGVVGAARIDFERAPVPRIAIAQDGGVEARVEAGIGIARILPRRFIGFHEVLRRADTRTAALRADGVILAFELVGRPHTHRPDGLGAGRRGFGDEQPAVIGMQGIDAHVDHFEGRSGSGSPLGLFARGIELRAGGIEQHPRLEGQRRAAGDPARLLLEVLGPPVDDQFVAHPFDLAQDEADHLVERAARKVGLLLVGIHAVDEGYPTVTLGKLEIIIGFQHMRLGAQPLHVDDVAAVAVQAVRSERVAVHTEDIPVIHRLIEVVVRRIDAVVIARIAIVGVVIGAPAAFVEPLRGTERGHVLRLVGNGCEEVAVDRREPVGDVFVNAVAPVEHLVTARGHHLVRQVQVFLGVERIASRQGQRTEEGAREKDSHIFSYHGSRV